MFINIIMTYVIVCEGAAKCEWRSSSNGNGDVLLQRWQGDYVTSDGLRGWDLQHLAWLRKHNGMSWKRDTRTKTTELQVCANLK